MGCDSRDLVVKGIAPLALIPRVTRLGESCLCALSTPNMPSGSHMKQPPWKWVHQPQSINTRDNFSPQCIRLQPHCCSVAKSFLTLCHPTDWRHQASLSFTISQSLLKLMSVESVMLSNHLILCRPLLLLPTIFPSIRVFSDVSALHIMWPKYWNFSFSITPSNEYSGLIFF